MYDIIFYSILKTFHSTVALQGGFLKRQHVW